MIETVFIYTLSNPITNEIRYIGKTNSLISRRYNHISDINKGFKTHKVNWIKSLLNQGLKPKMEIIDEVNINEWKYWERYWIEQFNNWGFNLVNSTSGGEGLTMGNSTSFKKGQKVWNKGLKRKIKPDKNVHQYSALTGEYIISFSTAKEAAEKYEINAEGIGQCARGIAKSAGGYIWTYDWTEKVEPIKYSGKTNNKTLNKLK